MYKLKNGFILDINSGQFQKGDILIDEGKILSINEDFEIHKDLIEEIDVSEKYIIPSLIDMHVHIKHKSAPLFTSVGVTTVRNTAGNVTELASLRKAPFDAATPRVISTDRLIDGPPGLWGDTSPWSINVTSMEETGMIFPVKA